MRAYRRRPWSSLVMNATPLIDVIFLLIIFFLLTINFTDVIARRVTLPKADEAREMNDRAASRLQITIKSSQTIFVGTRSGPLSSLSSALTEALRGVAKNAPEDVTVQLLGDENVEYAVIQAAMEQIALLGIKRIEFSTLKDDVPPFGKDM